MDDFSKDKIKEYKYWEIYINGNQSYLGRCVVWCKREDALDLTDTTSEEWDELIVILRELRLAFIEAFQTDWFNYSFLGNGVRHLHAHFVPRYSSDREFGGTVFKDELWGNNFKTNREFEISDELRNQIKEKIKEVLG
jgi:diadenosine tetraphosphate (Ap4A) HIT family hydrolase